MGECCPEWESMLYCTSYCIEQRFNFSTEAGSSSVSGLFSIISQLLFAYFPVFSQIFLISQLFLIYFLLISQLFLKKFPISQLFLVYFSVISHFSTTSQLLLDYFSSTSQSFLNYFSVTSRLFPGYSSSCEYCFLTGI